MNGFRPKLVITLAAVEKTVADRVGLRREPDRVVQPPSAYRSISVGD